MKIAIPGPAGPIEADLDDANDTSRAVAVLCHPHPQYGGNMEDAVLSVLARVLSTSGVRCLRFNFRGVGASAGRHDGQGGEADDLRAVEQWLRREHAPDSLILGGYSFGAGVIWQALADLTPPDRVILIAPPVKFMPFPEQPVTFPVDVLAGDADQFVDATALEALNPSGVHVIAGADHFFSGKWGDLAARIEQVLQPAT
ncbi:MAG: alpha/beta fold hydrolase [Pseudomonadales bacterium]|nr:alpha/beta fold hydrolase [Pseudomonadales bacterium]NIX08026.1 alpha/beta fold hydrolase [Pseudomonadales bacterium]